ncbi:MAG TPA: NADH-quinone oxidoreductase subunit K [Anaerolineales bacterium]|nr:NADH-quinone oxidoreductase subunit K [Anaerolineales bacterium]
MSILFTGVLGLIGIGLYGLLVVRNLLKIVIALQILIKAALLALIWAGTVSGQLNLSQSLAITVVMTDTIVAVVGLALAIRVRQTAGTLDVRELGRLRG